MIRELRDITKSQGRKDEPQNFLADKDLYDGNLRTDHLIMRNLKEEAQQSQAEIEEITSDLSQNIANGTPPKVTAM